MSNISAKELKKIAAACRKAGITHYKCGDLELTIADSAPKAKVRGKAVAKESVQADVVDSDDGWEKLTEDEKMFWSCGGIPLNNQENQ